MTSVISGITNICDIDMLLINGTSSLFNNVMQIVHELMTLLPLHWANMTLHLDLVYVVILLMVLVLKKAITGFTWIYKIIYIYIYIYICMLIDSLPGFWFHFIKWQSLFYQCLAEFLKIRTCFKF